MRLYFAADGSYGDASGLVIVDTSAWDESDWDDIDIYGDLSRLDAVRQSIERHDSPYTEADYLR